MTSRRIKKPFCLHLHLSPTKRRSTSTALPAHPSAVFAAYVRPGNALRRQTRTRHTRRLRRPTKCPASDRRRQPDGRDPGSRRLHRAGNGQQHRQRTGSAIREPLIGHHGGKAVVSAVLPPQLTSRSAAARAHTVMITRLVFVLILYLTPFRAHRSDLDRPASSSSPPRENRRICLGKNWASIMLSNARGCSPVWKRPPSAGCPPTSP